MNKSIKIIMNKLMNIIIKNLNLNMYAVLFMIYINL